MWLLLVPYLLWIAFDKSPDNGGRPKGWARRFPIWTYFARESPHPSLGAIRCLAVLTVAAYRVLPMQYRQGQLHGLGCWKSKLLIRRRRRIYRPTDHTSSATTRMVSLACESSLARIDLCGVQTLTCLQGRLRDVRDRRHRLFVLLSWSQTSSSHARSVLLFPHFSDDRLTSWSNRNQLSDPLLPRSPAPPRRMLRIQEIMFQHPLPRPRKRHHDRRWRCGREPVGSSGHGGPDAQETFWVHQDGHSGRGRFGARLFLWRE